MMSNYFAKLPRALIPVLFGTTSLNTQRRETSEEPGGQGADAQTVLGRVSRPLHTTYLESFRPKKDAEYIVDIAPQREERSRSHETLVNQFAAWLEGKGLATMRNQAIDLAAGDPAVIVEAKVLPDTGYHDLIRQAVGQLYEYRYFQITRPNAPLVFLSSRPLPDVWLAYLERDRQIGVAWPDTGGFYLSGLAWAALVGR